MFSELKSGLKGGLEGGTPIPPSNVSASPRDIDTDHLNQFQYPDQQVLQVQDTYVSSCTCRPTCIKMHGTAMIKCTHRDIKAYKHEKLYLDDVLKKIK